MSDESRKVLWDGARVEFRRLQADAEQNVVLIEKQAHGVPTALVATTNHLIQRMHVQVTSMMDLCGSDRPQWEQQAQRNALIVNELEKTLQRALHTIRRRDERDDLLRRVHRDINDNENSTWNVLHEEQESLTSASREVSASVELAAATEARLKAQRHTMMNTGGNLANMLERFPIINSTLTKIKGKKRREVVVLGFVVGLCLFLCFVFW
eukprot:PhM_4_TR12820/c0_g1_i1/m.17593/K08495/GOSR1, GOS1; golgi SNAP receptor complex member 1